VNVRATTPAQVLLRPKRVDEELIEVEHVRAAAQPDLDTVVLPHAFVAQFGVRLHLRRLGFLAGDGDVERLGVGAKARLHGLPRSLGGIGPRETGDERGVEEAGVVELAVNRRRRSREGDRDGAGLFRGAGGAGRGNSPKHREER
jgi:hypothetical protein